MSIWIKFSRNCLVSHNYDKKMTIYLLIIELVRTKFLASKEKKGKIDIIKECNIMSRASIKLECCFIAEFVYFSFSFPGKVCMWVCVLSRQMLESNISGNIITFVIYFKITFLVVHIKLSESHRWGSENDLSAFAFFNRNGCIG